MTTVKQVIADSLNLGRAIFLLSVYIVVVETMFTAEPLLLGRWGVLLLFLTIVGGVFAGLDVYLTLHKLGFLEFLPCRHEWKVIQNFSDHKVRECQKCKMVHTSPTGHWLDWHPVPNRIVD